MHDPRLLGRKQLIPQRVELQQRVPNLVLGDVALLARAARQVPTTTYGCRKMPRSWSMTADSISAAGTPASSTSWLTW